MKDDTISRQATIDAIHEDILLKPLNDSWYRENHEFVTVGYVERTLLAVPSAQPEIIRCKDCKRYGQENCFIKIQMLRKLRPDDFCSMAERRTK